MRKFGNIWNIFPNFVKQLKLKQNDRDSKCKYKVYSIK